MKSVNDLKKFYDEWQHIDNLYNGEKSNWEEIYETLRYIRYKLENLVLRKDDNRLFCSYIRRKMVGDIKAEEDRIIRKI